MPFENHGNRPFTAMVIAKNAPASSGVYGLSNAQQWIFVGETANIQAELHELFQHPNQLLRDHIASGYTFELSAAEHRVERQSELVRELHPVGNRPPDQAASSSR
jgi:hypothetical protein